MTNAFESIKDKLVDAEIEVYSTTWCPDCTRLKKMLENSGVAYRNVNIGEVEGAAERLESETGKRGVPYILVNDSKWVRGYHLEQPGRLNVSVLAKELADAL